MNDQQKNLSINHLIKNAIHNKEWRDRKLGRYWSSSDFYNIMNNKMDKAVEKTIKALSGEREKFSLDSCRNMLEGNLREDALKMLFEVNDIEFEEQPKVVLNLGGKIQLVVTGDFLFPDDHMMECKAPKIMPESIKEYNKYQLEAQWRAFQIPIYIGYFQERFSRRIFKYEPNDILWTQMIRKLRELHENVVSKLQKNKKGQKVDKN